MSNRPESRLASTLASPKIAKQYTAKHSTTDIPLAIVNSSQSGVFSIVMPRNTVPSRCGGPPIGVGPWMLNRKVSGSARPAQSAYQSDPGVHGLLNSDYGRLTAQRAAGFVRQTTQSIGLAPRTEHWCCH